MTTWVGHVDTGGVNACVGVVWEISLLSVEFSCELQTNIKNKMSIKKREGGT